MASIFSDLVKEVRDVIYPYIQEKYDFFSVNKTSFDNVSYNLQNIIDVDNNEVNINSVKANELNINTLAALKTELQSLYADKTTLDGLFAMKVTLDSLFADKATLDSLKADKATLDSLKADKVTLDSLFADKATLDSLYADKVKLDAVYSKLASIDINANNITEIQDALANARASAASASAALIYRNEAETFRDETQVLAGGEVLSSNVKFADLLDLETYRGNIDTLIANHQNSTLNPHNVTKAQVGLDLVNNTADMDKPVSTAQATALALKSAIADIKDDLVSVDTSKPLSANQGKVLKGLIDNINTILASDDTTLDEMQELVNFIKLNKSTLDTLGIANISGLQTALDGKLSLTATAVNSTKWNGSTQYTSTSVASGGVDGDIWFQY